MTHGYIFIGKNKPRIIDPKNYKWEGFKATNHSIYCPLCSREVGKAVKIGVMGDFRYGHERCPVCTLCVNSKKWNELMMNDKEVQQ